MCIRERKLLFSDECARSTHSFGDIQVNDDRFADEGEKLGHHKPNEDRSYVFSLDHRKATMIVQSALTLYNWHESTACAVLVESCPATVHLTRKSASSIQCITFARLNHRLSNSSDVALNTDINMYKAVALSLLLNKCETWTLHSKYIRQL